MVLTDEELFKWWDDVPEDTQTDTVRVDSIREATIKALNALGITTRECMENKGGPTTSGLYEKVQTLVKPERWASIEDPKCSIRENYQMVLPGYKIYNG